MTFTRLAAVSAMTFAQTYDRRGYYDDIACAGTFVVGISVPVTASCSKGPGTLTQTCIIKGQNPILTGSLKSSESSGCSPAPGGINDSVWLAGKGEGVVKAGAPYLTINAYTDQSCSPSALAEQNTFLSDGACYAVEYEKSFYKASCTGSQATLIVCSDSLCSQCDSSSNLNAGMYQVLSGNFAINKCAAGNGWAMTKAICTNPANALNVSPGPGGFPAPGTPTASQISGLSTNVVEGSSTTNVGPTGSAKSDGNAQTVSSGIFSIAAILALF